MIADDLQMKWCVVWRDIRTREVTSLWESGYETYDETEKALNEKLTEMMFRRRRGFLSAIPYVEYLPVADVNEIIKKLEDSK